MMWFVVATTICVLANNCSLDHHGDIMDHNDDDNKEIMGSGGNSSHYEVATFSLAYYNFCTPGILVYATSFLASHCFSLYNFISTWNRIMSARMMPREVFRTALYHTIHNQTASLKTTTTTTTHNACPICWEVHQECIAVCQSCRGSFHPECLSQWLDRRNSCPCCRAVLRPAEVAR
jgi:hypothetical protein